VAIEIRTILALIDFSVATQSVESYAASLARACGARLCFLHVEPPEPDFVGYGPGPRTVRDRLAGEWRGEHEAIQEMGQRAREAGIEVLALQIQGAKVDAIAAEAGKLQADLVVAAFHPHGILHRLAFGDTLRGLMDRIPCPVLLITGDRPAAR
jgi:nucleotide-binding universal stress UspA family protein